MCCICIMYSKVANLANGHNTHVALGNCITSSSDQVGSSIRACKRAMLYVPISSCTGHAYADPHVTVGRTPESHVRQNNAHALGRPAERMGRPCMQKVPGVSFLFAFTACSVAIMDYFHRDSFWNLSTQRFVFWMDVSRSMDAYLRFSVSLPELVKGSGLLVRVK
jgi:hypothetical protein